MENKEFNERLVASVPEMAEPYRLAKEAWGEEEPGTTIIVEDYLMPLIYKALEKKDEKTLLKVALWLEDMASSNDEVAKAALFIGVFEHSYFDGKIEDLKPYFLKETRKMYDGTSLAREQNGQRRDEKHGK